MKKIELIQKEDLEEKLYTSLKHHTIPDYFLYIGDTGVTNWLTLEYSEKIPISTHLTQLLRNSMPSISNSIPPGMNVVSIGVGRGEKERIILEELIKKSAPVYYPIDISTQMVDMALETVHDLPVEKIGLVGLFEDFPELESYWRFPILFCMLGNIFCNYEPEYILKTVHEHLHDNDLFLFDSHMFFLTEDTESIRKNTENMYQSQQNVLFNIGPLVSYGMDSENCEFKLDMFPKKTAVGMVYKMHKTLHICKDSTIACGSRSVTLRAGEILQLGFTYRYTFDQIEALLNQYEFEALKMFFSIGQPNILVLARKQTSMKE